MKARNKNAYEVVQLTRELADEVDQKSIRPMFQNITSVEVRPYGFLINTRLTRYDIPVGHWIMRDQRGKVSVVSDVTFQMNYEVLND